MRFKNSILIGVIIGFFAPLVFIYLFYLLRFSKSIEFYTFIKNIITLRIHAKIIAISIYFSNFILFYIFIKADYLQVAKGILIISVIYTLFMVIQKFL